MKKFIRVIFISVLSISLTIVITFLIAFICVKDLSIIQYDFIKEIFYFSLLQGVYMSVLSNIILKK